MDRWKDIFLPACLRKKVIMEAAVSADGEYVFYHFGKYPYYTVADIRENEVINKEIIENPGYHSGYLPWFF